MAKNPNIDVGLTALVQHATPRQVLSRKDIASVCGCTPDYIRDIERYALTKLKRNKVMVMHYSERDYI